MAMPAVVVIALSLVAIVARTSVVRIERALQAQLAAEVWASPVGGYWRDDQRMRAIAQRLGLLARLPLLGSMAMRMAARFLP